MRGALTKRKAWPMDGDTPLATFHRELHSSTEWAVRPDRTPYFYRCMAIRFARNARAIQWVAGSNDTYRSLAKHYLALYREALGKWQTFLAGGAQ